MSHSSWISQSRRWFCVGLYRCFRSTVIFRITICLNAYLLFINKVKLVPSAVLFLSLKFRILDNKLNWQIFLLYLRNEFHLVQYRWRTRRMSRYILTMYPRAIRRGNWIISLSINFGATALSVGTFDSKFNEVTTNWEYFNFVHIDACQYCINEYNTCIITALTFCLK